MRSHSKVKKTAAACSAAIAVLAGCRAEGLTKQQVVARGDAVCKETAEELNPLFARLFPTGNETPPASEAAQTMGEAAQRIRREASALSRLQPQENLQNEYRPIVEGLQEGATLVEESAELASQGDTEGYLQKLQEANRVDQDTRDLMVEFGFVDCGGGPPE